MARRKRFNKNQRMFSFARPKLPLTYGECLATESERANGKACQHFTCRHNMLGELTRMSTRDAIRAMCAHMTGAVVGSCALDIADSNVSHREAATFLGTGISKLRREAREAKRRVTCNFWDFKPWYHPECWAA